MKTLNRPELAAIRHVVLDMDGTIYRGGTLFPFTRPFLAQLDSMGIRFTFLTNNSSRSSTEYLAHLSQLQIATEPSQLYTSANATIDWLQSVRPGLRRLFALCTPSLAEEFTDAGFELARDDPGDPPDAVVVAFDMTLGYRRLCRAAYWIASGLPYFATHPDLVCPTDEPTVLVDCGSICAALEKATGRAPDRVFGKPDPAMLAGIQSRHNLAPHEVAMVGDRIYTDMAMARTAGCVGVLVLSGEATEDDARRAASPPDFVVGDIGELGLLLQSSREAN